MKNHIIALALLALSTSVAGDCMICPGGSLRDYWILQLKVMTQMRKEGLLLLSKMILLYRCMKATVNKYTRTRKAI